MRTDHAPGFTGHHCPLRSCRADARLLYTLEEFAVFRCTRCKLMYRDPLPDASELQAMYEDESLLARGYFTPPATSADRPEVPIYEQGLAWLEAVRHRNPASATLLDVGCGSGYFLARAREQGWHVAGVELSAGLAARARSEFSVPVAEGDFLSARLERERYDAICMWDFIEHVVDPEAVLLHARERLSKRGCLVVFTIDCASLFNQLAQTVHGLSGGRIAWPLEALFDRHHNYYFTRHSLAGLLESTGFRVERLARHRAHLDRWVPVPMPLWIRLPSEAVDLMSVALRRQYRQLLLCSAT